ncbi:MAG: hypothetical protein HC887_07245 [Desulfobacteraceae bacterium]|nr:hypothetical protein [Desulfobacteraceae bacterium]
MSETEYKTRVAPAIPYSRYIFWLENKDKDAAACYWREYLAGYEHPAYIPKGEVRQRLFITQTLVLEVEESVSRLLEKIAAQERVTPNVIFQSLWGVLLGAYNNTHDVVFGATVSGRPADFSGIEQMVGLFLNTIPVRIVSQNNQKFTELIRNRQQHYLESEPFHYASLANIQMLTPLKNDLLDHLMVFENYPFSQELADIAKKSDPGFSIGDIEEFERTNYDLHLEIYPGKKYGLNSTMIFRYIPKRR